MTVTFGMIGASTIGREALLEPVQRRGDTAVIRVAAQRPKAAEAYAREWHLPLASDDYEDVLTDPDVDAVYLSNAAADHARWTIAALHAGKHVLCEKPIAVTADEARAIERAAALSDHVVMEGFHYRFHPLFLYLHDLVGSGRFGHLRSIDSVINGERAYDPQSILHVRELGGGALLHNGVYGVHWTRLLFDSEPIAVRAKQNYNPSGADADTQAEFDYPDGRTASLHCSFERNDPVSLTLGFEDASVVVTGPIGPHNGHSVRIAPTSGPTEVRTIAGNSSFDYQLESFVERVTTGASATGRGDDIVANLRSIDAIRNAATSGRVEAVIR